MATTTHRSADQIAHTPAGPRPLPPMAATRVRRAPTAITGVTDAGLAVTAVRKPATPMVEVRLRIPFGGRSESHAARAELLAESILLGTESRTRQEIDATLASVGGGLTTQVGPQRLLLTGNVLAPGLPVLLEVLADVLTSATYPAEDVDRQRDIVREQLAITGAQPATIARNRLQRKRFGRHPAVFEVPEAAMLDSATAAAVRKLHREAVVPQGSTLILVGDLRPAAALELAQRALAGWHRGGAATALTPPPVVTGAPLAAYHRPGAVQTLTRLTSAGVVRTDPDYAAAQLANIVFGGYFSSRLVENLRESKGFTYHAQSSLEFWPERGAVTIGYDTATDVAVAALVETRYELGRIALTAPTDAEVEAARSYALGFLAAQLATQSGYASMLSALAGAGLGQEWLGAHQRALRSARTEAVAAAAARLFAPSGITGVIVGDLDATGSALLRPGGIEVAS